MLTQRKSIQFSRELIINVRSFIFLDDEEKNRLLINEQLIEQDDDGKSKDIVFYRSMKGFISICTLESLVESVIDTISAI